MAEQTSHRVIVLSPGETAIDHYGFKVLHNIRTGNLSEIYGGLDEGLELIDAVVHHTLVLNEEEIPFLKPAEMETVYDLIARNALRLRQWSLAEEQDTRAKLSAVTARDPRGWLIEMLQNPAAFEDWFRQRGIHVVHGGQWRPNLDWLRGVDTSKLLAVVKAEKPPSSSYEYFLYQDDVARSYLVGSSVSLWPEHSHTIHGILASETDNLVSLVLREIGKALGKQRRIMAAFFGSLAPRRIDLQLPLSLTIALRKIPRKSDPCRLYGAVLSLRDDRYARAFRRWIEKLDRSRISNLATVFGEFKGLSDLGEKSIRDHCRSGVLSVWTQPTKPISWLLAGIKDGLAAAIEEFSNTVRRGIMAFTGRIKPTHLHHVYRLATSTSEVWNVSDELHHAFGKKGDDVAYWLERRALLCELACSLFQR
jgi:hypothetical protein